MAFGLVLPDEERVGLAAAGDVVLVGAPSSDSEGDNGMGASKGGGQHRRSLRAWTMRQWCCFAVSTLLLACSTSEPQPQVPRTLSQSSPVSFSFVRPNGEEVSSRDMQGRVTLAVFVTTYDLASQIVLRRVNQALGSYAPRINALGVVMEAPSYAVLLDAFSSSLDLHFPVVMADQATLDGQGPFGTIDYIPTLVVLDREVRPIERLRGPLSPEQIRTVLDRAVAASQSLH